MHIGERNNKLVIKMWMALLLFVSGSACTSLQTNKMEQVSLHTEKAHRLRDEKKFQEALIEQQKAVDLDPTNAESLFYLAGIYGELGQLEKERDYLKESLKYDQQTATVYDQLGLTEARLKNYPEAVRNAEIAVKLEPKNVTFWSNLAIVKGRIGDKASEENHYRTALGIEPNNTLVLYNYAILKKESGDYNQALAMLYKVLERQEQKDTGLLEDTKQLIAEVRQAREAEKLKSANK